MSIFSSKTRDNSTDRQARLTELEQTIENARSHMRQVAAAGDALNEIRETRLYMLAYSNFEEYIQQRWQMTKQHAYDLMAASAVLKQLAGYSQQPTSIRQLKELAKVPEAERAEAWEEVVDASEGEPITGEKVRAVTETRRPKKKTRGKPKPQRMRVPGATVIIERNKSGSDFTTEQILRDALAKLTGDHSRLTKAA